MRQLGHRPLQARSRTTPRARAGLAVAARAAAATVAATAVATVAATADARARAGRKESSPEATAEEAREEQAPLAVLAAERAAATAVAQSPGTQGRGVARSSRAPATGHSPSRWRRTEGRLRSGPRHSPSCCRQRWRPAWAGRSRRRSSTASRPRSLPARRSTRWCSLAWLRRRRHLRQKTGSGRGCHHARCRGPLLGRRCGRAPRWRGRRSRGGAARVGVAMAEVRAEEAKEEARKAEMVAVHRSPSKTQIRQ